MNALYWISLTLWALCAAGIAELIFVVIMLLLSRLTNACIAVYAPFLWIVITYNVSLHRAKDKLFANRYRSFREDSFAAIY